MIHPSIKPMTHFVPVLNQQSNDTRCPSIKPINHVPVFLLQRLSVEHQWVAAHLQLGTGDQTRKDHLSAHYPKHPIIKQLSHIKIIIWVVLDSHSRTFPQLTQLEDTEQGSSSSAQESNPIPVMVRIVYK